MRARNIAVLAVIAMLAACLPSAVQAQDSNGLRDFHEAGFPTMMLFTGVALFAGAVYLGLKRGEGDAKGSASVLGPVFLVLCLVDFVLGVFLLFGPGATMTTQVNTLGLHLFVIASLGIYVAYTNKKTHAKVLFAIVVITVLALCGTFPWLNHNVPIWSIDAASCLGYFVEYNANFNRCKDKGYLQLLRTFGLFALSALLVQAFQLLEVLSSGEVLQHRGGPSDRTHLLPGFGESASAYNPPVVPSHHSEGAASSGLPSSASSAHVAGGAPVSSSHVVVEGVGATGSYQAL